MKKIEAEFSDHYRILFHVQKHKNIDLAINDVSSQLEVLLSTCLLYRQDIYIRCDNSFNKAR